MDTPVIGITTASLAAFEGVTSPQPDGSVVGNRYVQAVVGAGALPWPLPVLEATSAVEALYRAVDGLVLAGGSDIRPTQYGAEPGPHLDRGDPRRDEVERMLATWAWRDGKPVLGVCRGMQMLNVSRGGTLIQDLATDGGSKLSFVEAIRETGAQCAHAAVIFSYGIFPGTVKMLGDRGVTLHHLCTWWDVLAEAKQGGAFDAATLSEVEAFLTDPEAWRAKRGAGGEK